MEQFDIIIDERTSDAVVSGFGVVLLCSVFFRNFNIVPELLLIVDEVRFLGGI